MVPLLALVVAVPAAEPSPFAAENLVAWCVVPFDAKNRGPAARVEMLRSLGFRKFAYDWRAQHLPAFDEEVGLLRKAGIELTAVWFPANLGPDARRLLDVIRKHRVTPQLWVKLPEPSAADQQAKVAATTATLRPIAEEAAKLGCRVGIYNHGGWAGEPENMLAVVNSLGRDDVGMVYNLHHGHDHLNRFPAALREMMPRLLALNLNGMLANGETLGRKILPIGAGDRDLAIIRTIRDSGYRGPIGILGHTQDDAAERLADNLDGLKWVLRQLDRTDPGPRPRYRTWKP